MQLAADPTLCLRSDNHMNDTCDNCLRWTGSTLQQEVNLGKEISLSACGACRVVWYCSKVVGFSDHERKLRDLTFLVGLSKKGVEETSQSRVQNVCLFKSSVS